MRLVQIIINIKYENEVLELSPAQKVFLSLGGKEEPKSSPQGARVRIEDEKSVVDWNTKSCRIFTENVSDTNHNIQMFMDILQRIDKVLPIGKIQNRKLHTYWILPTNHVEFTSLEKKYRATMMNKNDITFATTTFDSSVIIEKEIDGMILHHQSGAMDETQLMRDYLHYKSKDIPKVFLFLEASITDNTVLEYSSESIQEFFQEAYVICKSHSDDFASLMRSVL